MSFPILSRASRAVLIVATGVVVACTGDAVSTPTAPSGAVAQYGKTTAGVSVTSVAPDSGSISTTLDVKVNGNGFVDGMVVVWQRGGVPDSTQIRTNSTRWVSAKQLIANITITSSATSGSWDVSLRGGGKSGIGTELTVLTNGFKVTDPTATWLFPTNDAALSIQSDHLYASGPMSVYANGVCGVSTVIFATTATSSSGDATLNTGGANGKCTRRFRVVYPDGGAESLPIFANLRGLSNGTYTIPIGTTVARQLHMGSEAISNVASRCGGLVWGYGVANNVAAGTDSVLVTRADASTWRVTSQPAPRNLAWCKKTGQLMPMPVDFTVVASRAMP